MHSSSGDVTALLTPPRRRGFEILDDPLVDPRLVRRSLGDVERSNLLFGGARAVLAELRLVLGELASEASLLDVGTGLGDIPARSRVVAAGSGVELETFGLDVSETLALASRHRVGAAVRADARALPFADRSIDVVICSQTLHHFADADARAVVRELDRVARVRVIISDLRRSWIAAAGLWVASFPLGFHPVSRHDGVVSIMRGYTCAELSDFVSGVTGHRPRVRRRAGFRVTAVWNPGEIT